MAKVFRMHLAMSAWTSNNAREAHSRDPEIEVPADAETENVMITLRCKEVDVTETPSRATPAKKRGR